MALALTACFTQYSAIQLQHCKAIPVFCIANCNMIPGKLSPESHFFTGLTSSFFSRSCIRYRCGQLHKMHAWTHMPCCRGTGQGVNALACMPAGDVLHDRNRSVLFAVLSRQSLPDHFVSTGHFRRAHGP